MNDRISDYEPMVQSIINRLNIRYDQEDYMQVGRMAVFNALSTFDDIAARGATESQFVYTRIYQRMIDEIRRISRYTNAVSATEDAFFDGGAGAGGALGVGGDYGGTGAYDDCGLMTEIRSMLGALDDNERIWLVGILRGYSVSEIADFSGYSVSSVKNWRKSARAKLAVLRGR